MSLLDKTTLRILFTILLTASLLATVWMARKPLLVFLFAMLFAYLLEPLIAVLQRYARMGRGLAIATVYLSLLAALLTVGLAVGPRMLEEARHLSETAPELYNRVATGNIAWQLGQAHGWSRETQAHLQQFIVDHRDEVLTAISAQTAKIAPLAGNALWLVLIPILAIFFLKEKSNFARSIESLVENPRDRQLLSDILSELDDMLSHFVRAQVYVAAISGAVYLIVLSLMRVPYALALGTLGGLLEFIPFVGPLVAGSLDSGLELWIELRPSADGAAVPADLARLGGLRDLSAGPRGTGRSASAGGDLRGAGGRRDCGRSRDLFRRAGDGCGTHSVEPLAASQQRPGSHHRNLRLALAERPGLIPDPGIVPFTHS